VRERISGNVSGLPESDCGSASVTWWGTLAFVALEGTGFVLAAAAYLYTMALAPQWPLDTHAPDLLPGTLVTIILVLSVWPNKLIARWAKEENLRKVQLGLVLMSVLGILPLIIRIFEFDALDISWDRNAYGSVVWFLLGLHTLHLLTDVGDTLVLAVLMFTRHAHNPKRFSDTYDNAFYWDFVVVSWVAIYALIYWVPRL
jgi:cytochrome c oxidase subunit III